jgi:hypothetical protein
VCGIGAVAGQGNELFLIHEFHELHELNDNFNHGLWSVFLRKSASAAVKKIV